MEKPINKQKINNLKFSITEEIVGAQGGRLKPRQGKKDNCGCIEMAFKILVLQVKCEGCEKNITERLLLQKFEDLRKFCMVGMKAKRWEW